MIERLPYDLSSVVDERGDVVPAEDYLDADGDIIERPIDDDAEINVHVEPIRPREEDYRKAEAEYEQRLEVQADRRNGNYDLARIELAERNILPPNRSMFGMPPDVKADTQDDEISIAVPNAIREDSLRRKINEIYARPSYDPNTDRQNSTEATRQQAIFQIHNERRHSRS